MFIEIVISTSNLVKYSSGGGVGEGGLWLAR